MKKTGTKERNSEDLTASLCQETKYRSQASISEGAVSFKN